MCLPVAALTAAQTMALTVGMNVTQYAMAEKQRSYNRKAARQSLAVGRSAEGMRQTEEMTAAEVERDTIRRKTRISEGQLQTIAASRGTTASASLRDAIGEFGMREGEYQSAITAKRDQQAMSGAVRDGALVNQYQNRMMQNKSQGVMGLAMAVGQGYLQGSMLTASHPDMFGVVKTPTHPMGDLAAFQTSTNPYQWNYG